MQRRIVLVAYAGVLANECDAFRAVLGLLPDSELLTAGTRLGACSGPGGVQEIDVTFDAIDRADVVVVPGGLGCERAAGLLHGSAAATHWLATAASSSPGTWSPARVASAPWTPRSRSSSGSRAPAQRHPFATPSSSGVDPC